MESKTRKGPVKVTAGAPAAPAKAKPKNKKRYYPPKPKAKIQASNKLDGNTASAKAAEKAKDTVDTTVVQPEPASFVWTDESQTKKTWIQRVLEWLPFVERK